MRGLLAALAAWCRLPVRGGFAELDMQIDKLRMLRDSYQLQSQDSRHAAIAAVNNDGNLLLTQ
ncbi:MAG: hypothetical protein H7X83_06550 [Verrucomicrobia bacterium]|nr:hypothetical protein [Deltaproteobacteria bacterium]